MNTTLKQLELRMSCVFPHQAPSCLDRWTAGADGLGDGLRPIAEALKKNKGLTTLDLSGNNIKTAGAEKIAEALTVNKRLTTLDLADNCICVKGMRRLAQALQDNHVLVSLVVRRFAPGPPIGPYTDHEKPLLEEIDRLLAVNRNFNSQLLAVTMAMHARLGAESGLKALDDSLLKLIFDQFFRASKTSSLLDNRDFNNEVEESLCSRTWAYSDSSEGEDNEFWEDDEFDSDEV